MDYTKYEKLIYKECWNFKKKLKHNYYLNIKELISEANLVFCKCVHTFDKNQNVAFSTFLVKCIRNNLKNFIRTQHNQTKYIVDFDIDYFIESKIDFNFFTIELSIESQKLINFIKNFPPELKSKKGNITKETLSQIMHTHLGYQHKEIKNIFNEIKNSL